VVDFLQPYLDDIWLAHMWFFLLYYAISDGLDLGVGILSLFSRSTTEVGILMGSIRGSWHGNQTWLVILAGMLFGAFPLFYAVVFSALYIPLLLMLFGLVLRGVAFEFRDHSRRKRLWARSFGWGSLIIAASQGLGFGALISGAITVEKGVYSGGPWAWFNPFSALFAVGVVVGFAMLGSNYLILKTVGGLQEKSRRISRLTSAIVLCISAGTHIWSLFRFPYIAEKWTVIPWNLLLGGLTFLAVLSFGSILLGLRKRWEIAPAFFNALVIVFSFSALSVGFYPYMIPWTPEGGIKVSEAAAAPESLMFMLYFSIVALPVIIVYTSYEYWNFRGKTSQSPEQ